MLKRHHKIEVRHFKNRVDYQKWLAYGHMHNKFHGKEHIIIGGHKHIVHHAKKK